MPATILVVEDEPAIQSLIEINLRRAGHDVVLAGDAETARRLVTAALPDMVLLDWMLPSMSGIDFARQLRRDSRTRDLPIIMLTARADERDKIEGFDIGVDDYISKPFSPREWVARIRAVLRRRTPEQASDNVTLGELTLDGASHRVSHAGQPIKMGPTEFKLLNFLMHHPERVHSRASLLDKVWGDHVFIEERTVDVHIKRLREVLGLAGDMVETVRGAGYRITTLQQK